MAIELAMHYLLSLWYCLRGLGGLTVSFVCMQHVLSPLDRVCNTKFHNLWLAATATCNLKLLTQVADAAYAESCQVPPDSSMHLLALTSHGSFIIHQSPCSMHWTSCQ